VVIATVFLTIIGMTGGYVLGERHRHAAAAESTPSRTSGVTGVTSPAPTVSVSGPRCPDPAQQAAAASGSSDLRQILMIVTDNRTTVWICEDPSGDLFYQSHTLVKGQDLPLRQNFNGLFLPGVTRVGDGYEVTDQKGNRFQISRERLQISFVSGKVQSNGVDTVEG
jgi:hypothetical protein